MFSVEEAKNIVKKNLPTWKIRSYVVYKNQYIFQVISNDPLESNFNPFFSVNKSTGVFRDFSPTEDGNLLELTELFSKT